MLAQSETAVLEQDIILVERNTQKFLTYFYTNLRNAHPEAADNFNQQVDLQMGAYDRIGSASLRILLEEVAGFQSGYLGFCIPQMEYIAAYLGKNRKLFKEISPYSFVLMCLVKKLGVDVGAKENTKPERRVFLDIPFET